MPAVVDDFTRECLGLVADTSLSGLRVGRELDRIGVRASVYDDAHVMVMSASLLGTQDVAVGFSHTGITLATLVALQIARKNGPRTIAITS